MNRIASGFLLGTILLAMLLPAPGPAETVEYDLTIANREVDITGRPVPAMTINGRIPGPTLRFREGDTARIRVHNRMSEETSIHWHGLLVPPGMDGVPYVSFPPIAPDTDFTYEFPIRQAGTYWYHSHTDLQEQRGVYGSIVIEPRHPGPKADRDHVVLFSDWTDEDPHQVLRTLKRGSEWFGVEKGSAQSIVGAARLGMLGQYFGRELMRMPPMDIADVAYDRFLANGKPETELPAAPGETVRLRIIDGSATTYFHLEFAGGPMTIVAADGQDVEPVRKQRILIGVAETYDVVVKIPGPGSWEFRATAHDGSGYASAWIGTGERHSAPTVPRPNLYVSMGSTDLRRIFALTPEGVMGMSDRDVDAGKFDRPGGMGMGEMTGMSGMDHGGMQEMGGADPGGMEGMGMEGHGTRDNGNPPSAREGRRFPRDFRPLASDVASSPDLAVDGMDPRRPWAPYPDLRATHTTAPPSDRPVRGVRLTLDGDMERYVWTLNNRPLSESDSIRIRKGEVVRFVLVNRTMMHHPMHLHGHFFRVLNGQGDRSPLKHTVDVAPMSTTVIEFPADEVGDWFFHCHLLYHMKAGMARVVHYEEFTPPPSLAAIRPKLSRDSWYGWGQADVMTHMTEGFLTASNTRNILTAGWEVGWQQVEGTEWEAILTWDRYVNRFFTLFAGADIGDAIEKDRGILGLRYLLPLNVETEGFVGTDREGRAVAAKTFRMTPRTDLRGLVQYDTDGEWEYVAGLSWMLSREFSLRLQWHSDYGFGGGVRIRF
ncbi:MAG: hypothetical protein Kow00128_06820 [Deltaproteobacteria bacterium]